MISKLMQISLILSALFLSSCAITPGMHVSSDMENAIETAFDYEGHKVLLHYINSDLLNDRPELLDGIKNDLPEELLKDSSSAYILGAHDIVVVTVWEHPELTQPLGSFRSDQATGQVIQDDGYMYYPYIGRIKAAGITLEALRTKITKKLSVLLQNPQVDVKVLNFRSKKVYVSGKVNMEGVKYIDDVAMTIPQLFDRTNGFKESADLGNVYLTRNGETYLLNVWEMYKSGIPFERVLLRDEDKVYVPGKDETKVYVLGEVMDAGAINLLNGRLSLADAIAQSGGINPNTANAEEIYVIRYINAKSIDVYHLNARNPLAMVMGDKFQLHPQDIIYVDKHGLARWNETISLLLPTASLLGANNILKTSRDIKNTVNDIKLLVE